VISFAENLVAGMQYYGRARLTGEIQEHPDQCLIYCGLNYAAFNAAVLRAPMVSHARELMRLIEQARDFYDPRGVRWTYWLCEDSLDPALNLNSIFNSYGLRTLTEAPGMVAELLAPAAPLVDLRPVADPVTRTAFARIISMTFDIPQAVCTSIYGSDRGWCGDFNGYVGYVGGKPVTTAVIAEGGGASGFYSVATLPHFRRKGYAESTMRQALAARGGPSQTVLQSTRAGLKLYEKMGYRAVTTFRVFIA
jgi:ribosomal protein S18 acetylase RimI-like enzyme